MCNLFDKEKPVAHMIRALNQEVTYGLLLKRVHRVIKFNQEALFKQYINLHIELRKKAKSDFKRKK